MEEARKLHKKLDQELGELAFKYIVLSKVDGHWGSGDVHLDMLKILNATYPGDMRIEELIERIENKIKMVDKDGDEWLKEFPAHQRTMVRAEDIFRDEGKDEAEAVREDIIRKFGESAFEGIEKISWSWP